MLELLVLPFFEATTHVGHGSNLKLANAIRLNVRPESSRPVTLKLKSGVNQSSGYSFLSV